MIRLDVLGMARLKVVLVADGDVGSQQTNSGVAKGLLLALQSHPEVDVLKAIDGLPRGLQDFALSATTFSTDRRKWWARKVLGTENLKLRARIVQAQLADIPPEAIVVYVRNIHAPLHSHRYVPFIDSTVSIASEHWPSWSGGEELQRGRLNVDRAYHRNALCTLTAGQRAAESVIVDYEVPKIRVQAIGGGANFNPPPTPPEHDFEHPRLLWVGLDWKRKGGDTAVEVLKELRREAFPEATLDIVGQERVPRTPGLTSHGIMRDRQQLKTLFLRSNVLFHPARHEPYGLVVQEAMANALPVVCSNVGELSSIVVDNETGLVLRSQNPRDYAIAITEMIRAATGGSFGRAGHQRVVDSFTWDAVAARAVTAIQRAEV